MKKIVLSLPFQLILCLIVGLFFGTHIPLNTVKFIYSISCTLKDVLMHVLPFIIFGYLWAAIVSFKGKAPLLILAILGAVILSNALALIVSYSVGCSLLPFFITNSLPHIEVNQGVVEALWNIPTILVIRPDFALVLALLMGFISNVWKTQERKLESLAFKFRDAMTLFLKKAFIPLLPLYVLGFVLKLSRDSDLSALARNFSSVFFLSFSLIIVYILFLYAIGTKFKISAFMSALREMLPAGITGFTTMSSAATLPVTLDATEKNLKNRSYADFVVPFSVNSNLIGDGLNITLTALALLLMTGKSLPPLSVFIVYIVFYCLAKFSAAGVPGGGVLVILPVVQKYLGLDDASTTLLATIYILQDPLLTASNVMGNGAFALVTYHFFGRSFKAENNQELSS